MPGKSVVGIMVEQKYICDKVTQVNLGDTELFGGDIECVVILFVLVIS